MEKLKIGVIQSTPVFFDLTATLQKMEALLGKHARNADLILFPESFLPGYPRGFTFGATVGHRSEAGRDLWQMYWETSVEVPGPITTALEKLAHQFQIFLVVGITEKDRKGGSLYCTMVYIDPQRGYVGKHRKLKPTGSERIIWAEGQGESLITIDNGYARLGGLICWENLMPLARMALYRQGVDIYLAPTADGRASWASIMQHIAQEGRCFVLSANQYFQKSDYPEPLQKLLDPDAVFPCRGGSMIVDPYGNFIEGPLWDKEGILMAEYDAKELTRSKLDFDVTGHYARPDLFSFDVCGQPDQIINHDLD
jgi:nitrilase